jgi:2-aminoadipate transaminase
MLHKGLPDFVEPGNSRTLKPDLSLKVAPVSNIIFSRRAQTLTSSAIRDILKVTERPEVISFAGGLPAPETFPCERIREVCDRILLSAPSAALQYGPSEGYAPLREWIARHCSSGGRTIDPEQVLITTGSQQALDLLGKVLVDQERSVLVETPTYLGALQALSLFEPKFISVPSDDSGPLPEEISALAGAHSSFLYLIPNFQNPTGRRIPLQRRLALLESAARTGLMLVEDDPYGELSYDGTRVPSLLSLDAERVVHVGSFSKLLAPGLRVGYVITPKALHGKLVQAKQAADLHTPSFTQRIVYEVVKDGFLAAHIPNIRAHYANQCRVMLEALERHFPAQARWNFPEGGMFIWVTLPVGIDASALLELAIRANVAFVPGAPFYAGDPMTNTMRLSFVTVRPERIEEGIARLGEILGSVSG